MKTTTRYFEYVKWPKSSELMDVSFSKAKLIAWDSQQPCSSNIHNNDYNITRDFTAGNAFLLLLFSLLNQLICPLLWGGGRIAFNNQFVVSTNSNGKWMKSLHMINDAETLFSQVPLHLLHYPSLQVSHSVIFVYKFEAQSSHQHLQKWWLPLFSLPVVFFSYLSSQISANGNCTWRWKRHLLKWAYIRKSSFQLLFCISKSSSLLKGMNLGTSELSTWVNCSSDLTYREHVYSEI